MLSLILFVGLNLGTFVYGVTPKDQALPPGETTTIECEYKGTAYHYKVYIPEGYDKTPDRKYPAIFIFSPGGNANIGVLKDWITNEKWVAIMMVESQNGPWEPIIGNIQAAYPDALERLRIQPGLLFATGFSGGARACSLMARTCPGFAGVILQGAGTDGGSIGGLLQKNIAVAMTMGNTDSNMREFTSAQGVGRTKPDMFHGEIFDGGHEGGPKEYMERALDWLKKNAFLNAAPGSLPKEVVAGVFLDQFDGVATISSVVEKSDHLDWLLRLASRHGLNNDKDLKEKIAEVRKQLIDLPKDPKAKKELSARDAYNKAKGFEDSTRQRLSQTKAAGNDLAAGLTSIMQAYATVAKQYKETECGTKAEKKVEELTKERG